jgi:sulfofructosephosphate aldolase
LRRFKSLAVGVLSPYASAVLLDRPFALASGVRPANIANNCALIAAVDVLHQLPGQDITSVTFDELVTPELLESVQAVAIKILVLWHRDSGRAERDELVTRTMDLAATAGVASLVEGIVRPEPGGRWETSAARHAAILDCARELTAFHPDIYKAEVPGYVLGDLSAVTEQSVTLSEIVAGDWVILSNGVERDAFPEALALARRGGASGFLAGRAVWADTVADSDIELALRTRSIGRLNTLTDITSMSDS